MTLQTKAVVVFNFFVVVICACMGFLGYRSADEGFGISLQMKAESNVQSILEIMQYKYPRDWQIVDGELFKGSEKMNGNASIVDYMGNICKGHVTIFQGDTRVATTVKKADGQRSTGTKASEKVIGEVLRGGKNYTGVAEVVGAEYNCAYSPIRDASGATVGMLFVGLPAQEMDIQKNFIMSVIVSTLVIMVILGVGSWFVVRDRQADEKARRRVGGLGESFGGRFAHCRLVRHGSRRNRRAVEFAQQHEEKTLRTG